MLLKKTKTLGLLSAFLVPLFCNISIAAGRAEDKPNPTVDYVAKINELGKTGKAENLNASAYYKKAVELYAKRPDEIKAIRTNHWPSQLTDQQQSLLKEWVKSNSNALTQLELGAKMLYYCPSRSSPDGTAMSIEMPGLDTFRQLIYAITWRAKLTAAEGNIDKAIADAVTCYRFGLHMSGPKPVLEQLIAIAIRGHALQTTFMILDKTKASSSSMKTLQTRIEQLATEQTYVFNLQSEKLAVLDFIQRIFTDGGKGNGRIHIESAKPMLSAILGLSPTEENIQTFNKLRRRQTTQAVEKVFQYLDTVLKKTPGQHKKEKIDTSKKIEKISEQNILVKAFCPVLFRIAVVFVRCKTETRALITTLALLRYKADKNCYPQKLDELVSAGYLKAVPIDPFSDKPFVYKQIGDNFMLYSFAQDCDDDDGSHDRSWRQGDYVFWPVQIPTTAPRPKDAPD